MKYWLLDCCANDYENLTCEGKIDLDFIKSFNGEPKLQTWNSPKFRRLYDREYSNTPSFASHIPIFDQKAVNVLNRYLVDNTEVLPITCSDGNFYAINVINIQDCINYEKSQYIKFRDGVRIMKFTKYVFDLDKIKDCGDIFKLKDEPLKRPFVSDKFKKAVIDNNLTGFKFELAWDSEENN